MLTMTATTVRISGEAIQMTIITLIRIRNANVEGNGRR